MRTKSIRYLCHMFDAVWLIPDVSLHSLLWTIIEFWYRKHTCQASCRRKRLWSARRIQIQDVNNHGAKKQLSGIMLCTARLHSLHSRLENVWKDPDRFFFSLNWVGETKASYTSFSPFWNERHDPKKSRTKVSKTTTYRSQHTNQRFFSLLFPTSSYMPGLLHNTIETSTNVEEIWNNSSNIWCSLVGLSFSDVKQPDASLKSPQYANVNMIK